MKREYNEKTITSMIMEASENIRPGYMPTWRQLSEYYGSGTFLRKVSEFGGTKYWAKQLSLKMSTNKGNFKKQGKSIRAKALENAETQKQQYKQKEADRNERLRLKRAKLCEYNKQCKCCRYYGKHLKACEYILQTGHKRGCPVRGCTRYEKGNNRRAANTDPNFLFDERSEPGRC